MEHFDTILAVMKSTKSIEYTKELAVAESNKAKEAAMVLPDSPYKEALLGLAEIAVNRSS
jgi:octaprenyl-diphosphate synthase